jgi:hypothetical protein
MKNLLLMLFQRAYQSDGLGVKLDLVCGDVKNLAITRRDTFPKISHFPI